MKITYLLRFHVATRVLSFFPTRRSSDLSPESSCGLVPPVKEVPLKSCVLAFDPYNTIVYTYEGPTQEGEGFRPFLVRFRASPYPVGPAVSTPLDFLPDWSFYVTFVFVLV